MKAPMKRMISRLLVSAVASLCSVFAFGQTPGVHRFPMHTDSGPVSWNTGTYQYDAAGNIVAIGPQAYTYDVNGRLVDAHVVGPDGASNQSFGFDPYGNLTSAVKDTVATSISVTSGTNRLTYAGYDPSGNVTSYQPPSSTVTYNYTYDGLNMVQKSADSASHQSIYVYTADDERIWTYDLSAGVSHWKIRDLDNKELRDYTDTGASTWAAKDYFYRGSLMLAAMTPAFGSTAASQEHFSVDHLGTPRLITNASQQKIGFHTYYPFGQEWLSAGNDTESRKFTGHERDADPAGAGNDIDYMHARYYMPNVGRFLSVDPTWNSADIGKPQNWNRYSYVLNSPVRYTDPDGRCTVAIADCIVEGGLFAGPAGAFIGAAAGVTLVAVGSKVNWRAVGEFFQGMNSYGSGGERFAENWIRQNDANHMAENANNSPKTAKPALPKPPRGKGSVQPPDRDPKRKFSPQEREAKRDAQGGKCANGCGKTIDQPDSNGHHIVRHADGGKTEDGNHAEVCIDCHKELHSPPM
jgi:RHS repeat-associated protein